MEQNEKTEKKSARSRKNREYTVIAYFFLIIFIAMIAYFVYFQFVISETFINSPYNSLQNLFSERVVRGPVLSSDGEVLAETKVSNDGTEHRVYPYENMYASEPVHKPIENMPVQTEDSEPEQVQENVKTEFDQNYFQ